MLASIAMEPVRSFPRNPSAPMRHPSAEDLDAAQQLISSAQAGREHSVDHYGDHSRLKTSGSPSPNYGAGPLTEGRPDGHLQERTSPRGQKDTSFLGHSCR